MIPADALTKLKQMFAEDGLALTDAEALEIGLWLLGRVRPILKAVPLDKMDQFAIMKTEATASRQARPLVNLYEWRRRKHRK